MSVEAEKALKRWGLTQEESRKVLKKAMVRAFPKDRFVVEKGLAQTSYYFILEGRVKVFVDNSNNQETLLANYCTGDCFGDIAYSERLKSISILTIEPSNLLVLSDRDFKSLLSRNHLFAKRVIEKLLHENGKQAAELSDAGQQQAAVNEILRAISSSPTNLRLLLEAVVKNAARLCDVTDAAIMRVEGDRLRVVAKHGPSGLWPKGTETRPINRNWVNGRAVLERKPIHVHDLCAADAETEFPEGSAYAKLHGTRAVFVAPLMRKGLAIGTIFVRRFDVRPLTDKQIALLMAFADQAAIAIENVRLFNEIKEKSRKLEEQSQELAQWNATLESRVSEQVSRLEQFTKLEHELSLAGDIQKSMLPRSLPQFEGFEFCAHMIPAKSVGGDFFDFIPLGEDSLAIAIGDVADKGIPAALFMAMVRSLLRAEVQPGHSPRKILQRVNRHIMDMNDKGLFVTVLLGILDRTKKRFSYARAGHELPVFMDNNGSIMRLPKTKGQVLGAFDEISLEDQVFGFKRGCTLVLYSDGIPDAANNQNIRFGIKRIFKTISNFQNQSASTICNGLIDAVNVHQDGGVQYDDMTLIVIRAV